MSVYRYAPSTAEAVACSDDPYVRLLAAILLVARADAEWDDHAYRWLRTAGVRWAGALGIEHPECVAEGIR